MTITILVESIVKDTLNNNTRASILYCDFATKTDAESLYFRATQQHIAQNQVLPTGLHIVGINSRRRLDEDYYYRVDIDTAGVQITYTGNTSFDSYIIDFSIVKQDLLHGAFSRVSEKEIVSFLGKAKSTMALSGLKTVFDRIPKNNEKELVRVKNVGQGNWNEYHVGNQIPLIYDLGTDMRASNIDAKKRAIDFCLQYASLSIKPVVILSHWDLDHYRCLLEMTPKEIGLFAAFVVVETLPTATAQKAYDLIAAVPGMKVVAIQTFGKSKSKIPIKFDKKLICDKVSIYPGFGSNRNSKGLIAIVKNEKTVTVLSGDSLWCQLNHALRNEDSLNHNKTCNLIVPHHGSGKDETYLGFVAPGTWAYGDVAISVGQNRYKHPQRTVVNYLKALFSTNKKIRTDKQLKDIDLMM